MIIVRDGVVINRVVGQLPAGALRPGETAYDEDAPIGWVRQPDGSFADPHPHVVDLVAYAATRRWDIIETTRLDIGECSVPTDKVTRDTLTAGYVKASANPSYEIADWKVGPGQYVTLDAATIILIADAVEAFVQLMFWRNRIADEAIEAGTATTTAHVDSILAGEAL